MGLPVWYVAHPLGTGPGRELNLLRVKRWLKYLLKAHPDKAFCLPWVPYAEVLSDEPANHERGLRDDLAILRCCDGIVLCGGTLSPGMAVELNKAKFFDMQVMDLLELGNEPPASR